MARITTDRLPYPPPITKVTITKVTLELSPAEAQLVQVLCSTVVSKGRYAYEISSGLRELNLPKVYRTAAPEYLHIELA